MKRGTNNTNKNKNNNKITSRNSAKKRNKPKKKKNRNNNKPVNQTTVTTESSSPYQRTIPWCRYGSRCSYGLACRYRHEGDHKPNVVYCHECHKFIDHDATFLRPDGSCEIKDTVWIVTNEWEERAFCSSECAARDPECTVKPAPKKITPSFYPSYRDHDYKDDDGDDGDNSSEVDYEFLAHLFLAHYLAYGDSDEDDDNDDDDDDDDDIRLMRHFGRIFLFSNIDSSDVDDDVDDENFDMRSDSDDDNSTNNNNIQSRAMEICEKYLNKKYPDETACNDDDDQEATC